MIEIIPNSHPIFVHFTLALLSVSSASFVISALLSESKWKENCLIFAKGSLWLGALIMIGTVFAGWHAYNTVAHDAISHAAMTDHRNWALVTATLFIILTGWSIKCHLQNHVGFLFVVSMVVATMLLMVTGYKGAELVYRYGVGVMSLPHGQHSHKHDGMHHHSESMHKQDDGDSIKTGQDH